MKAENVSSVGVLGAGTMGAVIAGELARAGCCVSLMDIDLQRVQQGIVILRRAQQSLIGAGLLSRRAAREAIARIEPVTDLSAACRGADLIVEAVAEKLDLKRELFRQCDRLCPKRTLLATNTSGLSVTAIAAATKRPTRVAGLHFWNPPHIIPLVEVTRGRQTSAATAALLMDLCRRIGKKPILVRHDVPGFVGNRLQFAVLREALHLLSEGIASAEDIDAAMTAGPGLRYGLLGPLRTADLGGLDIFHAIGSYLFAELSSARRPPAMMRSLVKQGKLGAKSGRGFYTYSAEDLARTLARRDRVLLGFLKVLKAEEAQHHE